MGIACSVNEGFLLVVTGVFSRAPVASINFKGAGFGRVCKERGTM